VYDLSLLCQLKRRHPGFARLIFFCNSVFFFLGCNAVIIRRLSPHA